MLSLEMFPLISCGAVRRFGCGWKSMRGTLESLGKLPGMKLGRGVDNLALDSG